MPHEGLPPIFESPRAGLKRESRETEEKARLECEATGGTWDSVNKICTPKPKPPKEEPAAPAGPQPGEIITNPETGEQEGFIDSTGQFIRAGKQDILKAVGPTATVFEERRQRDIFAAEGQQLVGQIGEFGQLPISPTGLDVGEAATTGVVSSIPSALRLAVTGAGVGIVGGATVGALGGPIGAGAGAAIGAVAGFVGGISSGMISNFKSQRTDTTTAQQRVLDEGKQTLKDWATMAKNDPANRNFYLGQFNQQSALIKQAHRQMQLDTNKDLAKFETALPNLAEFETFYSDGGESEALEEEMRLALTAPIPEGYDLFELVDRRKTDE